MIRLSSAARSLLATELGLAPMFGYGHIQIFTGPMPASPDAAAGQSPIAYITRGGGLPTPTNATAVGVLFAAGPVVGSIIDTGDWFLTVVSSGRAGWWRLVSANELNAPDGYQLPRIDGTMSSAFTGLASLDLAVSPPELIRSFALSIPFQTGV